MQATVLAAVSDLFFAVKIQHAAQTAGVGCSFVKTEADLMEQAKALSGTKLLVLIDLNDKGFDAVRCIAALKADETTRQLPLLGYVSHVQVDLRQAALDAGCDQVLARSALAQNLSGIFQRLVA